MLSAIFDQASKSVTRTVLYAGVIPVAATVLINLLVIAMLLGEGALTIFNDLINRSATSMAGWTLAATLLLVIAGIAVAALTPIFRGLLEGRSRISTIVGLAFNNRERANAENEQRRAAGDRAKERLAHLQMFRRAEEEALAEAWGKAARSDPSPSIVADLDTAVSGALAADATEAGARQASTRLMQHFRSYGRGGTRFAHDSILARLDALVEAAQDALSKAWRLSPDTPSGEPLTRYGRRLQYIETYVGEVYRIDSIIFLVRLNHVIPAPFASRIEDAKHSLDLLSSATVLLWSSTIIWFIVLPFAFPGWAPLAAIVGGGVTLGYITYVSAAAAALSFAELVCAAFDLFRRDLLNALGIEPPLSLREERAVWLSLGQLTLYQQVPDDLVLKPAKSALQSSLFGAPGSPSSSGPSGPAGPSLPAIASIPGSGIVVPNAGASGSGLTS